MSAQTATEKLLGHQRLLVLSGILLLTLVAWWFLFHGAGMHMSIFEMAQFSLIPYQSAAMSMDMPEMGMHLQAWVWRDWSIALLMWWVMMVAMMLPSATPTILLYARVMHFAKKDTDSIIVVATFSFMLGYLSSWLIFSFFATFFQWALQQANLLSMLMIVRSGWLSGLLLVIVGLYQLSPFKQHCLKYCQSPASFISTHMRYGQFGAYQMGLKHGIYCVGCCWLLMLLLFVGGVMNLVWIAILSIFVLAEKAFPHISKLPQLSAILLLTWGMTILMAQTLELIK